MGRSYYKQLAYFGKYNYLHVSDNSDGKRQGVRGVGVGLLYLHVSDDSDGKEGGVRGVGVGLLYLHVFDDSDGKREGCGVCGWVGLL